MLADGRDLGECLGLAKKCGSQGWGGCGTAKITYSSISRPAPKHRDDCFDAPTPNHLVGVDGVSIR